MSKNRLVIKQVLNIYILYTRSSVKFDMLRVLRNWRSLAPPTIHHLKARDLRLCCCYQQITIHLAINKSDSPYHCTLYYHVSEALGILKVIHYIVRIKHSHTIVRRLVQQHILLISKSYSTHQVVITSWLIHIHVICFLSSDYQHIVLSHIVRTCYTHYPRPDDKHTIVTSTQAHTLSTHYTHHPHLMTHKLSCPAPSAHILRAHYINFPCQMTSTLSWLAPKAHTLSTHYTYFRIFIRSL